MVNPPDRRSRKTRGQAAGVAGVAGLVFLWATDVSAQSRPTPAQLRGYVGTRVTATVTSVVDGDTIRARLDSGAELTVRLAGIDAPERNEPFSLPARNAARVLLFDRRVALRGTDVDRYRRLVARVIVGGRDASVELLMQGLACHLTRYSSDAQLAGAQTVAKQRGAGFWAAGVPKPRCVTASARRRRARGAGQT